MKGPPPSHERIIRHSLLFLHKQRTFIDSDKKGLYEGGRANIGSAGNWFEGFMRGRVANITYASKRLGRYDIITLSPSSGQGFRFQDMLRLECQAHRQCSKNVVSKHLKCPTFSAAPPKTTKMILIKISFCSLKNYTVVGPSDPSDPSNHRGHVSSICRKFATFLTLFHGKVSHGLYRDERPYLRLQYCSLFQGLLCHVADSCGADATLHGGVTWLVLSYMAVMPGS